MQTCVVHALRVSCGLRVTIITLTAESGSGGNSQQDGSLHISVPSASAVAAQRHRLQQQLLLQQQQQEQQQQAQHGSQRAQHGSQPAQQQAQQQQQQQVQQGSQRAQHGSQHAQQQREGNIQSVSHKRRLSQAFAQVRGVEQTPGDEAEEGLQVKRQRHGGEQASRLCTCHPWCCLMCVSII